MRMRSAAVVAGLVLVLMSGTANAAYIFTFSQTATGVLEIGHGSITTDGVLFSDNSSEDTYIAPTRPEANVGTPSTVSIYEAVYDNSTPFGTGPVTYATTYSGSLVAFNSGANSHAFEVPVGYKSGSELGSSSAFFEGSTFNSLGLHPGTYVYNYVTASGSDSFTVDISLSAVPLPASAPMFGAALLGLAGLGYAAKRKKAAVAA